MASGATVLHVIFTNAPFGFIPRRLSPAHSGELRRHMYPGTVA
jgi:hypothetical protein